MKNKQIIILYASLVILFILAIYAGCKEENMFISISSIIVILIPAMYSVIPLIKDYKVRINKDKNRLCDSTFTDREEDIKNLLQKLSIKEHIIEISGFDRQCGKTWIAKKLCDYINHPEDIKNADSKCPYKNAYYINLDCFNEYQLENFFETKIINTNVVLIFDNVCDMGYILSKQSIYHFQLVYILKDDSNENFFKYKVSPFQECNIEELQNKIKINYPGIESITENEIHVLYNVTNGNIGKIHSVLSKQNSVKWIRDIATYNRTEYDNQLDKIKLGLFMGNYEEAKKELNIFYEQNKKYFNENNDLYYKFTLIKADCEHLLNNYQNAIDTLALIEVSPYNANNKKYELELCKAHYFKHLWKCNEALDLLHNIWLSSYKAKVDALGILLAKYFIDDLYIPYAEHNSLEEFFNVYLDAKNSANIHVQDQNEVLKYKRCTAIYLFYKNKPSNLTTLIDSINEVIEIYQSQNNRLLANAYFIRGEIYRLYKQYDNAVSDYIKCNSITYDNNIIVQTNLMVYYLKQNKQLNLKYNSLPLNEIIKLCQNNNYAERLWHRINSIRLNDPNKDSIIECFETRIMPIL